MKAVCPLAVVAAFLASCSSEPRSSSIRSEGDFLQVHNSWKEYEDPIDGATKLLFYSKNSENLDATLALSCELGNQIVMMNVRGGGSENLIAYDAEATIKLDTDHPIKVGFTARKGDAGLRPGDGSYQASQEFMAQLQGKKELAIRFDRVLGMASSDLPMKFQIDGIDAVLHNITEACKG